MPWISTENFYYYDSQNEKPILLDIHGFGVSAETHYKEATHPLEKYYRIIIPELPGHGELKHLRDLNIEFLVAYLESFIEHLTIKGFKVLGRSVGGILAIHISNKINVENIVVIEAPIANYENAFNPIFRFFTKCLYAMPNLIMLNCDHKFVLSEVKNLELDPSILTKTKAKFIYSDKDLYLTDKNRSLIKEMNKPLYIDNNVAHFSDQTKRSTVELIRELLES